MKRYVIRFFFLDSFSTYELCIFSCNTGVLLTATNQNPTQEYEKLCRQTTAQIIYGLREDLQGSFSSEGILGIN